MTSFILLNQVRKALLYTFFFLNIYKLKLMFLHPLVLCVCTVLGYQHFLNVSAFNLSYKCLFKNIHIFRLTFDITVILHERMGLRKRCLSLMNYFQNFPKKNSKIDHNEFPCHKFSWDKMAHFQKQAMRSESSRGRGEEILKKVSLNILLLLTCLGLSYRYCTWVSIEKAGIDIYKSRQEGCESANIAAGVCCACCFPVLS